jgi:hypothetical protein
MVSLGMIEIAKPEGPMKSRQSYNWTCCRISLVRQSFQVAVLAGGLALLAVLPMGLAAEPLLDSDILLKPLVDTSQPNTREDKSNATTLQGKAERQGTIPVNETPTHQPLVLTGKVKTLQQAIESEKDTVDWYAWYLAAREYLSQTGGIRCPLGTPIKFYRNGRIEAMSFDPYCISSVSGRNYPLPHNTQLDALILPVRPGQGPPASRQEIYSRVNSLKFK